MTKIKFLLELNEKLTTLPQHDVEERLRFYSEMIEDRMEEGLSEEDAVAAVGTIDEIVAQIYADILPEKTIITKREKKKFKTWEIVLLAVGSPVWFALLVAAIAVAISLYVSMWSLIIALWSVFVSLAVCSVAGVAVGIGFACQGNVVSGCAVIGMALVCAGLAIFFFCGCKAATDGAVRLTQKIAYGIKGYFNKKEVV